MIEVLGVLAYEPAQKQLEGLLTGSYAREAIEALRRIDPEHHVDRLVRLALNKGVGISAREEALVELAQVGGAAVARRLLPLLEETTAIPGIFGDGEWAVCDQAAQTIASVLGWEDSLSRFDETKERKKLIAKIRQWAKEEARTRK